MAIEILTSIQDDFDYYDNLGYLRKALENGEVQFQGFVNNHAPDQFVFENKRRIYDFTRTAKAKIRDNMTTFLTRNAVLQGIQQREHSKIRGAFDGLFNYYGYEESLKRVNLHRHESMRMLIFNQAQGYVAHVVFSSTSRRTALNTYTVNATLTCQRFSFFARRQTDHEVVLRALQNLHL